MMIPFFPEGPDTETLLGFTFPSIQLPEEELDNPELLLPDTDELLAGFTGGFFFSSGTRVGTSLTGLTELANVPLTGSKMLAYII